MATISRFILELKENEKGQTAVEYVMMLAVITVLATSFMKRVSGWVMDPCSVNPRSLNCMFEKVLGNTKFRYFTLRR